MWSTLQMPYNGMSFASLEEAKEYYSSYVKRTGFSIRTNTSCRSTITREMQKVHFMCDKEGFGRKRTVAQLVDAITCYYVYYVNDEAEEEDSSQEVEDEQGEKWKKLDGCKKRKRENAIYKLQGEYGGQIDWF